MSIVIVYCYNVIKYRYHCGWCMWLQINPREFSPSLLTFIACSNIADAFLVNIIEKLIGRLRSLAMKIWNVPAEIEKLRDTISTIKAVLVDAEEQQSTKHEVKDWLEKLKDAVQDAEDLLDDFSTEALRRKAMTGNKKAKKVRIFFSKSNQVVYSLKMAHKIKEIREKLEAIDEDRKKFHLTSFSLEKRVEKQRQTHSFIRKEDVIGREDETMTLIELLLDTTMKENVSVTSIVGIGGVGKTALAQLAYNDEAIQRHFELKMWVCVSDDFDIKAIAEKMVGSKIDGGIDLVQQELRQKIEGKRYLLVLDDTWNESRDDWLKLRTLLMDGGKGSKIVVTARSNMVARITSTSSPLFLKGLDEERAWELFSQLAFDDGLEQKNQKVVSIGKEIVRKCAGVPLAIRSIGSLMYFKMTEKDWLYIKNKDLVKIIEQQESLFQILKLSYDHLPSYLKSCFAYCSLFPKDHKINRHTLIQLWMAQGFIQPIDGRSLDDVGYEYFMDLVWRSFFQNVEMDNFGGIATCKMHDLMHDLAVLVARDDCAIVNEIGENINRRTRHVSFGSALDTSWEVPASLLKANKLRTILLPCQSRYFSKISLKESPFDLIMLNLGQLRALDLHRLNYGTLPSHIGMLKHLRFLDLSDNHEIEVLPRSVTRLQNLQTLILYNCYKLRELPEDIRKLMSLRHLELRNCHSLTHMPHGLGNLTNLQTLSLFVLDKKLSSSSSKLGGGISELSKLNDLTGCLKIKGLECLRGKTAEVKAFNLMEKQYLEALELSWNGQIDADDNENDNDNDDIALEGLQPNQNIKTLDINGFGGLVISNWVSSLTNIIEINITNCTRLQHLPFLNLLSHLKVLSLSNLPSLEFIDNGGSEKHSISLLASSTFFPSLKQLYLYKLPNLRGWRRSSIEGIVVGHLHHQNPLMFPSLSQLRIVACPNLSSMPLYPYVEHITLDYTNEKILRQDISILSESPLSRLTYLCLADIDGLKSLSGLLQHLTTLDNLSITNCDELHPCNDENGDNYGMQWKELRCLRVLFLRGIPEMAALPEGLQYVTTLQRLNIHDCPGLKCLPEWIANLASSLEYFEIIQCDRLRSMPEGVRYLTCLREMQIVESPHLNQRCQKEVGEDWPKVSHVPKLVNKLKMW